MYQLKKRITIFLLLLLLSYALYRAFIKTGYEQAIVIEDIYWGVEKKVIPPESFTFLFRRLIPERIKLHPIYIKSRYLNFIYYYSLPPNEILGLDDSFSIKLDLVYVYDLDIHKLPDIFVRLEQRDWKYLNSYIEIKLKDLLYQTLQEKLKIENNLVNGEELLKGYINNGFLNHVNQYFQNDGIYFKKIYIQDLYVPDSEQYNLILRQSNRYLEKKLERSALIDEAKAKKESQWILFQFEKEKLENLAKMIRDYPEVLDYLKIEKLSSQAKFIYLPSDYFYFQNQIPSQLSVDSKKKQIESIPEIKIANPSSDTKFIDKTPP
ncbi:MAG: hypothetical protein KatS3mg129_2748 [Leptospiraceae bacterium]|nr:MAG: hypothetical protein KatS3mg129_2748 [Leptospiraceae bacterium]